MGYPRYLNGNDNNKRSFRSCLFIHSCYLLLIMLDAKVLDLLNLLKTLTSITFLQIRQFMLMHS